MAQPWHQQPGETAEQFARFLQFLELGPERTLASLARLLGISRPAVSQVASRQQWKVRAAAYDANQASGKRRKRKPAPIHAPSTPPPLPRLPGGHAVGLEGIPSDRAADPDSWDAYVATFRDLGIAMAREATALLPVVSRLREDLATTMDARRELLRQGDVEKANILARAISVEIPQYARFCDSLLSLAAGGRSHYGDAVGVHSLLQEFYGKRPK